LTIILAVAALGLFLVVRPASHSVRGRLLVGGKIRVTEGNLYAEEWQNFFGTQIELLKSEKMRQRVLARLQALRQDRNASPVRVEASQERRTTIINVQATGPDSAYTEAYVNALMEVYLGYRKEVRAASSDETLASLTIQFEQQEADLKKAREQLLGFEKTNSIALLEELTSSVGISKWNAELTDLKLELQFLIDSGKSPPVGPVDAKALADSGLIKIPSDFNAKELVEMLKFQKQEMGKYMRPEHPKMVKLDEQIAQAERIVTVYKTEGEEDVASRREVLQLKIHNVEEAVREWEKRVLEANGLLNEHSVYKANVEHAQDLYDRLLRLLENVGLDKKVDQENLVIMDRATPMQERLTTLQMAFAPVIGLAIGLALVMFLISKDDRITSALELKGRFSEKIVGHIPDAMNGKTKGLLEPLVPDDKRRCFAESYRGIYSALMCLPPSDSRPKTILIASTMPGEGKSTVVVNLAKTIAFTGSHVLVIDADARTGKIRTLLDAPPELGLENKGLAGTHHGSRITIESTSLPNLSFMSFGENGNGHGQTLIVNSKIDELLAGVSQKFDFVLIDTAPLCAGADALLLAPKSDAVIFVMRDFYTPIRRAREALDQLYQRRANVLGIVYNRANGSSHGLYPVAEA
jgi:polysaccharide biosynthesis transport protein